MTVTIGAWEASLFHARNGPSASRHVQLPFARGTGTSGSSVTCTPQHGGPSLSQLVVAVRCDVCQNRPAFDSAREVAPSQLIQMLYSIRSERLLIEEIDYSMLFRWFIGMNLDEPVWDVTVFTKNRNRLLEGDVAREFLTEVVQQAQDRKLTSDEHFTVDGTLIEAWASLKSFQRKEESKKEPPDDPGNPTVDFHGEKRSNQTHESSTDPDALLARKGSGKEAKLSYTGNLLTENRNGLIVGIEVLQANGTAERDAALVMLEQILAIAG